MHQMIARLIHEEDGQDLIEYALLAGFISLVAIAAVTLVGEGVNNVFGGVKTKVDSIPTK